MKIMLADDQELIRESLKVILSMQEDMEVLGVCPDGQALLDRLADLAARGEALPDCLLLDIRMPGIDGVEVTRRVKALYPEVRILMLTTFDDDEYVYKALQFGASGYLLKGVSVEELTSAVRRVVEGGTIVNPELLDKVMRLFRQMTRGSAREELLIPVNAAGGNALTKTERQIAQLVGRGLSNKEIAAKLHFSEGTIRNGLSAALAKLELRDRTQLAIWAVQTGLAKETLP
ncbi:response regulator transcription factor [Selenomonas sp. TAMA-11512]|uniref:response regulator transcription factor n=1 Tax=Selenomonas sp. TAMA-11512 TaxID=3095337 RepID=UPI00308FF6DE|nr:response regulator transcription factor [Selenomonas sp. TAMA-11512]